MKAKVQKVKKFVDENGKTVFAVGVTCMLAGGALMIGLRKGLNAGLCTGFNSAIIWCNSHFPETDIANKYSEWAATNADKMTSKFF